MHAAHGNGNDSSPSKSSPNETLEMFSKLVRTRTSKRGFSDREIEEDVLRDVMTLTQR